VDGACLGVPRAGAAAQLPARGGRPAAAAAEGDTSVSVYYVYFCVCMYIYIYIYRLCMYIYTDYACIYTQICIMFVCVAKHDLSVLIQQISRLCTLLERVARVLIHMGALLSWQVTILANMYYKFRKMHTFCLVFWNNAYNLIICPKHLAFFAKIANCQESVAGCHAVFSSPNSGCPKERGSQNPCNLVKAMFGPAMVKAMFGPARRRSHDWPKPC